MMQCTQQKNMRRPKLKFQTETITVRNSKKFNLNAFLKELESLPFNQIRLVSNHAKNVAYVEKSISNMRFRDNKAPYITSELKSLIMERDYLKAKANKTGSRYFYQAFLNIRNQAKDCYISLERITTHERLRNARVI